MKLAYWVTFVSDVIDEMRDALWIVQGNCSDLVSPIINQVKFMSHCEIVVLTRLLLKFYPKPALLSLPWKTSFPNITVNSTISSCIIAVTQCWYALGNLPEKKKRKSKANSNNIGRKLVKEEAEWLEKRRLLSLAAQHLRHRAPKRWDKKLLCVHRGRKRNDHGKRQEEKFHESFMLEERRRKRQTTSSIGSTNLASSESFPALAANKPENEVCCVVLINCSF